MTNARNAEAASGRQFSLRHGDYEADIASVGATLRALRVNGRDLVFPFAADQVRPMNRGVTLAPWPNRIVDGRYRAQGVEQQLALTEPERGHALHGLVQWLDFEVLELSSAAVHLSATVVPQAGYPWRVRVLVRYELTEGGLTQTVSGENLSDEPAPWGIGCHPYLVAGQGAIDGWTMSLPARQVLSVTADRLAPIGVDPLSEQPELDFRLPRPLGPTVIDHAYTGIDASNESNGLARVELRSATKSGVAIEWNAAHLPWVQVFTSDVAGDEGHRAAVAVEPMSCAPDAFNDDAYEHDTGLISLEPGATHEGSWRIFALAAE